MAAECPPHGGTGTGSMFSRQNNNGKKSYESHQLLGARYCAKGGTSYFKCRKITASVVDPHCTEEETEAVIGLFKTLLVWAGSWDLGPGHPDVEI